MLSCSTQCQRIMAFLDGASVMLSQIGILSVTSKIRSTPYYVPSHDFGILSRSSLLRASWKLPNPDSRRCMQTQPTGRIYEQNRSVLSPWLSYFLLICVDQAFAPRIRRILHTTATRGTYKRCARHRIWQCPAPIRSFEPA